MFKKEDPALIVALAMAKEICPGCICYLEEAIEDPICSKSKAPCPFFHPRNFYYDKAIHRFWCENWLDTKGNNRPPSTNIEK